MTRQKIDPWDSVVRSLRNIHREAPTPIDPAWIICYNDGTRNLVLNHKEADLSEILQAFEDFCKGCRFVFDGFAIVDEDGIPVNGLNPLAKLEGSSKDEDTTG
jgi:hypothetical protein